MYLLLFSIRSLTKIFSIARANEDATSRRELPSRAPVPKRPGSIKRVISTAFHPMNKSKLRALLNLNRIPE